jgi:hypothetical protein
VGDIVEGGGGGGGGDCGVAGAANGSIISSINYASMYNWYESHKSARAGNRIPRARAARYGIVVQILVLFWMINGTSDQLLWYKQPLLICLGKKEKSYKGSHYCSSV